jgi:hypothetical protein
MNFLGKQKERLKEIINRKKERKKEIRGVFTYILLKLRMK